MKINWTRPGRAHLIAGGGKLYATLILFGRRFHFTYGPNTMEGSLWQ